MKDCNEQVAGFERSKVRMSEDGRADIYSKAKHNRKRLRSGLERKEDPKPVGFNTQGSYAMRTMIQHDSGDYDVDDGVYFARDSLKGPQGADKAALDARKMVCEALQDDRFAEKPQVHNNCVRLYYADGYHVDVPVYRRIKTMDASGVETESYELASTDWKPSDPLKVTHWFKDENKSKSHDATANGNDGQFVRIVRLVKAFARSRDSWKGSIASGFAISKLVADNFSQDEGRDDRSFRSTMRAISTTLSYNDAIRHPVVQENIAEPGDGRTAFLKERIDENLKHLEALDVADCTHKQAMTAWDKLFSTDWFSSQPDPSDKGGLETASGPAVIKRGETRYANETRHA